MAPSSTPLGALEAGDAVEALSQCLARWPKEPSAELGDVIVALGAHVSKPLTVEKAEWEARARAKDPQWLTPLLETLVDKGSVQARTRLTVLATWPADPRIDRWAAELLAKPPFTSTGARPFFTQVAERAKSMSDPTAIARLRAATGKRSASDPFKTLGAKVLAAVDGRAVPPVPAEQASWCRAMLAVVKTAPEVTASSARPKQPRASSGADALLVKWRETFDPRLVTQLDDAERAAPDLELPVKLKERVTTLIAASNDLGSRTRVAEATVVLAQNSGIEKSRPIIQAWLALEPDPRFGRATVALLNASAGPFWTGVSKDLVKCLFHHVDAATAQTLSAKAIESFVVGPVARKKWDTLLKTRAGTHAAPAAAAPKKPTVSRQDEAALLAAIVANPADDAPRAVYADWLLEQGDRRGEFIQLQLARAKGRQSPEAKEREKQLFVDLRGALMGPLNERFAKSGLEFKRGFLAKGTPYRLVDDPRLSLLEQLDAERLTEKDLGTTPLSSLTSAKSVRPTVLARLLTLAPRLESVGLTTLGYGDWRTAIAEARPVKHVSIDQRLYLDQPVALVNDFFALPFARELETLSVGPLREAFDVAALVKVPPTLRELVLETKGGTVTFRREGGRFVAA